MVSRKENVDWAIYAQKYDMLMEYNPFYQELHQEVLRHTEAWDIQPGACILDLGAGTGNYSTALARRFPQAQILHVDRDEGMNVVATRKSEKLNLQNLQIISRSAEEIQLPKEKIQACLCIHSLYTLPAPEKILQNIYHWLVPGGWGLFVDPGSAVNVLDWQVAIVRRMVKVYGWRKTFQVLREAKIVSQQNRAIRKKQIDGTYWTHSHEEFLDMLSRVGFEIRQAGRTYRNISDWAMVRKPLS